MRVEDIVVGNEVMLLKDVEEVQRAFCPAKGELRKRRVVVYQPSMKHYIGQRGKVIRKDGEGVTQVQYKDSTTFWFPPEALRPSLLTSRLRHFTTFLCQRATWKTPKYVSVATVCASAAKQKISENRGYALGIFKLCNVCVFSDSSEARSIFNAAEKKLETVKLVYSEGKNVNALKPVSTWTPLHCACRHGHLTICEFLLRNGAIQILGY